MTRYIPKALFSVAAALLLTLAGNAMAEDSTNTSRGLTAAGGALAVHGYDTVSYFTEGKAQRGVAEFSVNHEGAVYRFVSEKNQKAFTRNPNKYLPQFGGFCAYGVAVGKKFDGDPEVFKIVKGKLYLNLNPDIQATWEGELSGNIGKADDMWKSIREKSVSSL